MKKISKIVRWTLVIIGIYVVFHILSGVYAFISGGSITDLVWVFASDLAQDQQNHTNFLLLGTGGGEHDGKDLTDTFMIASYDHDLGTLALLSIPRDLWAEAGDGYGMRLNRIYEYEKWRLGDSAAALESVTEVASEITDLPIHYYIKVDFAAFTDLIDGLGGVDVLVEYAINDPFFPCKDLLNFCPFNISEGLQKMDGETALKFARSRKTTSDFDRAERQQKVIEAIREKALKLDILSSPGKLKDVYNVFEDRMETNLRFREILKLGKIADGFNKQNIAQIVLSDEPTFVGGLLYAPDRDEYNGAAVLIPNGNSYQKIHQLCEILFDHPRVIIDQLAIEVLNGSGRPRVAEQAAYALNRYGLNSARINNYPDGTTPNTVIYFYNEEIAKDTLSVLENFIYAPQQKGSLALKKRGFDATLVLGEDWAGVE